MVDGRLQVEGQSDAAAAAEKLEWKRQEEMTDALGNVVRARALSFALMDRGLRCCVLDTSYACLHGCQRLPAVLLPGHDRLRGSGLNTHQRPAIGSEAVWCLYAALFCKG